MSQTLVFDAIYKPLAEQLHHQQFAFNAISSEMANERQSVEVA